MKIVFIGGRDIHKLGGIENYMYNLATQLVKMGHEPIVFCESDHNGEEWVNGFRVIHQKSPKSKYLCKTGLSIKATWKTVVRIKNADIIHYNAAGPGIGMYLARILGQRHLVQGHGLEWERTKYSPRQRVIIKAYDTFIYRTAQNAIMCSETQTKYYKSKYGLNTTTIPTAVNLPDLNSDLKSDILERFGIDKGKYFLFLARLVRDKNPHILIESFLKSNHEGYKLVIAGNNDADPQYVGYLHELGKSNKDIIFTDAVYGDDKEMLLRNAYTFCIPSTIEGLSISLLEAMSYKLPIIASDIPSNHEVLSDDNALWCKAEDVDSLKNAIEESISRKDWFQRTGEKNLSTVRNAYTWPIVASKYIDLISNL